MYLFGIIGLRGVRGAISFVVWLACLFVLLFDLVLFVFISVYFCDMVYVVYCVGSFGFRLFVVVFIVVLCLVTVGMVVVACYVV